MAQLITYFDLFNHVTFENQLKSETCEFLTLANNESFDKKAFAKKINTPFAYIRHGDKLYYFNKVTGEYTGFALNDSNEFNEKVPNSIDVVKHFN